MIIVAALINAGLLIVLFVSGVKPADSKEQSSFVALNQIAEQQVATTVAKPDRLLKQDPIDQVIYEYNTKVAQQEKKEPIALPLPPLNSEPNRIEAIPKVSLTPPSHAFRTIIVEKGDVLERIARQGGVSVEELMKLNHLSNSHLQVGQVLKLPAQSLVRATEKKTATQEQGQYYVIKGGDNPWTIAQKNGMQVDELLELNHMDEEKAKRLRPGDKLRIK